MSQGQPYIRDKSREFWQRIFAQEADYLARSLPGCRRLLSVGCGQGNVERLLIRSGFEVIGLDPAIEWLAQRPKGMRAVAGRAEEMPFAESVFDAVVFVASLQFVEDYQAALRQAYRVMRPHGRLVLMLLNPESAFFLERQKRPDSFFSTIRHPDPAAIVEAVRPFFELDTDTILDERLFIVHGRKKAIG